MVEISALKSSGNVVIPAAGIDPGTTIHVAVNSVLRDWIKGQVTAIETGVLSFEAVFMPHMLTPSGQTVLERIKETNLLPAPEPSKVVSIATG